jgi:hypothetical protein
MNLRICLFAILLLSSCSADCLLEQGHCEESKHVGDNFLTARFISDPASLKYARGTFDPHVGTPNHFQFAENHFEVEAYSMRFFEAVQQRRDWCWAAAVSMVMEHQGFEMSQCDVLRSLGKDCNSPEDQYGTNSSIANALNGFRVDRFGQQSLVSATSLQTQNGVNLIGDLARNSTPIVGMSARDGKIGHVYVLTSIEYSWAPGVNQPVIWSVGLFDPWDGKSIRLRGEEFDDFFDFAVRVAVAR